MKKKKLKSLALNKKSISSLYDTVYGGATLSCGTSNVTQCGICPIPSERGNCLTQVECPVETHDCATLDRDDPVCFSFRYCF